MAKSVPNTFYSVLKTKAVMQRQLKAMLSCKRVPGGYSDFVSGRMEEIMDIPSVQDGTVVKLVEESLAIELQLQSEDACFSSACRLCTLYNAIGRLWTDQGTYSIVGLQHAWNQK